MADTAPTHSFGPSALLTPANIVTLIRIAAAPVAFAMILSNGRRDPEHVGSWPLLALWFCLSMSDMADGALARRQGSTRSGAFLDPLADKIVVLGGLGCVAAVGRFPWVAVVIIALREVAVSAFRSYWSRGGKAVPASSLAKWKTFVQLGAVGWVTWPWFTTMRWLTDGFLWIGVALAVVSGVQYFVAGQSAATSME